MPEGVKKLKLSTDGNYSNITEVKIPDSVTCLYVSSDNLIKKIKLPAGVEYYYDYITFVEHWEEKNVYGFGVEEITVPANVKVSALPLDVDSKKH